jgi:hypothetical protein
VSGKRRVSPRSSSEGRGGWETSSATKRPRPPPRRVTGSSSLASGASPATHRGRRNGSRSA